jgi:hypothetical protein
MGKSHVYLTSLNNMKEIKLRHKVLTIWVTTDFGWMFKVMDIWN